MKDIQIIRLVTGEDIVGHITNQEFGYMIYEPMMLRVNHRGNDPQGILQLAYWLPVELIRSNSAVVQHDHVITVLDPDDNFKDFYLSTVQKIKDLMETRNNEDLLSKDDIMDIMESMKLDSNQMIH